MTVFSISIADPALLSGISAAREDFNKAAAEGHPDPGLYSKSGPRRFESDEAYVEFLLTRVAEQFAPKAALQGRLRK